MKSFTIVLLISVGFAHGANPTTPTTTVGTTRKPPLIDSKIVGGVNVNIVQFPYQLALLYYGRFICGGSIIAPRWFLTAAHCVAEDSPPNAYSVRAGSTYQASGGSIHIVSRYVVHPKWNPETFDYDFTVMKVTNSFRYGFGVMPICLSMVTPAVGSKLVVSGWGTTSAGGSTSPQLKAAVVNLVDRTSCNVSYSGEITKEMICASYPGRDSCQGDSGGPLVDLWSKCQCGVVSWGESCALPNKPGVYAEVSKARKWIYSTIG